ncbi:cadherin-like beta sandwich domain-containing protein [Clostridium weizhouense]|uniref:Cadherin-like beta sandwich domain-containing protein n=1 Tax=Clostridium weizhouense TaxID=2859781 RepID=A0ABS7AQ34_9CLOT|nr:cadherin-like beta sandwich domain-containing protein [Clostridium weizhouense]MBW6410778.1 cadherin-like beta sandwich domain-containing protein [Clostridium weizhouense]
MGKKISKKRIISLFLAFTCIFSLLPTPFGGYGEQANAATTPTLDISGADYALTVTGTALEGNTADTDGVKVDNTKTVYTTRGRFKDFQIDLPTYKEQSVEKESEEKNNTKIEKEITTTIKRTIEIQTINRMTPDEFNTLGCTIEPTQTKLSNGTVKNGVTIKELPLGSNEVVYKVKETKDVSVKETVYDINIDDKGNKTYIQKSEGTTPLPQEVLNSKDATITMEHASEYAQGKIRKINFSSYVGSKDIYKLNKDEDKNKVPFLYKKELITTETESFFTYEHVVNDQINSLDYEISFEESFNLDGAVVWMDGAKDSDIQSNGNKLTGFLTKTDSKILVISIPNDKGLGKNYAIKLKFKDENSKEDYTLRKVDIESKYNNDEILAAQTNYIGKEFYDITEKGDSKRFTGKIHLDKRAGKVRIAPTFGAQSGFVVKASNHYIDEYGKVQIKQQDFDKYVSFTDSTSTKPNANVIYLDVYQGSDSSDQLGALIATYELEVVFNGESSVFNFNFGNATLKEANGGTQAISFNSSIHKYDFYVNNPTSKVNINFETSLNLAVAQVKVNGNEYSIQKGGNLDLDLSKSGGTQMTIIPYKDGRPASEKYIFNIQGEGDDGGDPETPSEQNAYLGSLNFSTGDLKQENGNIGFTRETLNYDLIVKTGVSKLDVTAIVDEPGARISETKIMETGDTYDLVSGTKHEISLQEVGQTTLQITVTAKNGKDKKMYTITIKADERSNNAKLKNVELNTGDYTFKPDNSSCKVRVDQDVRSIKVKPIPEDENYSKITVDGNKFSGTPISVSLKGQWKTEIDIDITAEDGTTTKTYTLKIYRTNDDIDDIKDPDDDDDDDDDDDNSNKNDAYYDESNKIWIDLSKYEEWAKVNGKYVYFDKRGRQVKDAWVKVDASWYFVNKSGYRLTGWKQETDGKWYYLNDNGKMVTGWFYDKESGKQHYFNPNGTMKTGWLSLGGYWYYFDATGKLLKNENAYIDGRWYSFSNYGTMYQ